jgi:polyphosphate glucokinase
MESFMKVLVIDAGGTHIKVLVSGAREPRKFASGPTLTAKQMVAGVKKVVGDWRYDVVSIGFPGPVLRNHPVAEPRHLGGDWVGFDFRSGFDRRVKLVNDAAMQALGSYRKGKMLFLGFGTGLGSALIVDGIVEPMELGHLPYKKGTYESYVGNEAFIKYGKRKWRQHVADVVARLTAALEPDEVVLGGGNAKELKELPPKCRAGDNRNAFLGGFRLWEEVNERQSMSTTTTGTTLNTVRSGKDKEYGSTSGSNHQAPSPETAGMEGSRRSL